MKLMELSLHGGCAGKVDSNTLNEILSGFRYCSNNPSVLSANESNEDALVYRSNEKKEILLSSLDFCTPMTNCPETFGEIASCNALSDIYAMGGNPAFALAILGYPKNVFDKEIIKKIMKGALKSTQSVNVVMGGGHTIYCKEPIFGLSVTGFIKEEHLKKISKATPGDSVYLTKSIGTGVIFTAEKLGTCEQNSIISARKIATKINILGSQLGKLDYVNAMTDITGFGLVGHLVEIAKSSKVSCLIDVGKIPFIEYSIKLVERGIRTSGGKKNSEIFKKNLHNIKSLTSHEQELLFDPQTNGGLVFTVKKNMEKQLFNELGYEAMKNIQHIGYIDNKQPIGMISFY